LATEIQMENFTFLEGSSEWKKKKNLKSEPFFNKACKIYLIDSLGIGKCQR
jgi:hypothetical protein